MKATRYAIPIIMSAVSLFSCGAKSDEALILELMHRVGDLAEKRDVDGLMCLVAEDYRDFEGRDKNSTRGMVDGYFRRYRGIVIHVLSTRIEETSGGEASIQTDMALSSGAAQFFRKLVKFSADNYRFRLSLGKTEGQWRIRFAEWSWISPDELFPESLTLLKKFFGGHP